MATVVLPDTPTLPVDTEDAVAALFAAAGFHVQRGIIQREESEVLELDLVAGRRSSSGIRRVVVEAKSGLHWGYEDLFKLLGQMVYLGIPEGYLFAIRTPHGRDPEAMSRRFARHGIRVVPLAGVVDLPGHFTQQGIATQVNPRAYDIWRLYFAVERALIKSIRTAVKEAPELEGPAALTKHAHLLNNKLFFAQDEQARLVGLYQAFSEAPHLTVGIARELSGKPFDCSGTEPDNAALKAALYDGKHDVLQATLLLEHRARMAILTAAVEFVLSEEQPRAVLVKENVVLATGIDLLPPSFRGALEVLRSRKDLAAYPVIWQNFVSVLGGFLLKDRHQQEIAWLASLSATSTDTVEEALGAFDLLFPLSGNRSWFVDAFKSSMTILQMMPPVVQGLGAVHRRTHYGVREGYDELGYADWTAGDLSKRHSATHSLLVRLGHLEVVKGA